MVFQNISRATQEMHALYDIAQTLGTRLSVEDTMGLLTSKLTRLVPVSCWALYLHDESSQTLTCRFASGLEADLLDGLRIPMGEGASGWAARHRTPAVNARAEADFEAGGREAGAFAAPVRAGLPAGGRRQSRSARSPCTTRRRARSGTITGGCSIASATRWPR